MIGTLQLVICDVCRLLDYDTTKKLCKYCDLCDSWICEKDGNWLNPIAAARRIAAAIKRRLEGGYRGQSDYPEKIQAQLKELEERKGTHGGTTGPDHQLPAL